MRSSLLLVKRNLRKRRGQAVAMLLLALLGAALLDLGAVMATAYGRVVDDKLAEANAPDGSSLLVAGPAADQVIDLLRADPEVRDVEAEPSLTATADTVFGGESFASGVIVVDRDRPGRLGRWRVVGELSEPVERPIWAPVIYDTAGGYDLGDALTFSTASGDTTFHIQGFIEHPTLGMPAMGALGFAVPASEYAALAADPASGFRPTVNVKVDVVDGAAVVDVLQRAMVGYNRDHPDERARSLFDSSTELMRSGATIGSNIFAGGFVLFALIIVAVALVVMRFLLVNAITDDMRSLGVLRASGLTTRGATAQLAGTFALVALAGSIAGVALAQLVLPTLASALSDQTGLRWRPGLNLPVAAFTVLVVTGVVLVVALLAGRRLRQHSTITAIRGGAETHSFARNPLPLETTGGRLNVLLGLKAAAHRVPQQLLVGVTLAVVAFTTVLAVGLSANVLGDRDAFMQLLVGDLPDGQIQVVDPADAPAIIDDAERTPGVERAFLAELMGTNIDGSTASVQVMDDYAVIRYDSTYEGRPPRHGDEIALGATLASRLDAAVGDRVDLDLGGYRAEYLVSGLMSTSRGLGMTADLTTDGMRRADPGYQPRVVALHVAPGADIDAILGEIAGRHAEAVEAVVNVQASLDGQLSGYQSMVGSLSNIIVGFMIVVVVLVVALIVSTMVRQGRRTYGVLKAVGFATGDLRRQTILTWLPAIALGALVGGLLGVIGLNPSIGAMLRFIGIRRADFSLDWWVVPVMVVALTVLAALVIRLAARGLGRVSAYALVTE